MSKSIYNKEYRQLVDALKSARVEAGFTQQQVADAIGRPQSYIAKVEGRERRIDIIEFIQICRVIDCNPLTLLASLLNQDS